MTTVRELIKGSLRLINTISANEEPSADDVELSRDALNALIDSKSNDLLNIHTITPYRFALTGGSPDYKLGPEFDSAGNPTGADWVTERPMRIENAVLMLYADIVPDIIPPIYNMILIYDTNLGSGETIQLPLRGTLDCTVFWGDGQSDTYSEFLPHVFGLNKEHTYASPGLYTVRITGTCTGFGTFMTGGTNTMLTHVVEWANLGLTNLEDAFISCDNLQSVPSNIPSTVTHAAFMFQNSTSNPPEVATWDMSNVTSIYGMFTGNTAFNRPIGNWNTSSVTDMRTVFSGASAFNQPIGNWNTANVTQMGSMFAFATSFNQNLSGWCVSNIPSPPASFDLGASSWVLPRPVWGTCP